jgi:hypothetical protein
MTGGFHISIVAPSPLMKTTGAPAPHSLYASITSSTATVLNGIPVTKQSRCRDLIIFLPTAGFPVRCQEALLFQKFASTG